MTTTELLLIDLSSLAHPLYHMSGNEPDPNWTSNQIVSRVRALSSQHPHTAICCDSGKSFRHDLAPRVSVGEGKYEGYKANRPERDARLTHQIDTAIERLREDGYPIWKAENAEADDVIATATARALAIDGATVLIATADKDLLQLVSDRVRVKNVAPKSDGAVRDVAGVIEKLGVHPSQVLDYLCLVGDTSDNVKGAKLIGPDRARELLKAHGSIQGVYDAMSKGVVPGITPTMRTNLMEFRERWPLTRQLIALKSDVEIPFEEIAAEREAKPMEETPMVDESREDDPMMRLTGEGVQRGEGSTTFNGDRELPAIEATTALGAATARVAERMKDAQRINPEDYKPAGIVPYREAAPVLDFSQQLEPRNMADAVTLAQRLFDSRLFSGTFGQPQAVLAVVLAGRELGMGAMKALRSFHIIEGKPTMSAGLIVGQVLSSGKARYFKPTKRSADAATFKTLRVGEDEEPFELTYTIEEGRQAFGFTSDMDAKSVAAKEQKWAASGWGRNPADMLVARASSKLARLVYPDVVSGLYAPEEME